ncbi:hypothetical protein GCM10011504_07920 [Siccirubricoccus deserti]|nr:hypothetical protein GCM10011504_07920 [Siccirubricoccus deserti]
MFATGDYERILFELDYNLNRARSPVLSLPIVYLDTQDYSRFGDVLRGKADISTEKIFNMLEARKRSGNVIFALSMPILGELLQYNADFRETTLKKAEAVERLCGGWALSYPSRLIAAEIAMAANRLGLLSTSVKPNVLWADRYWYPNAASTFGDLGATIKEALETEVAALPSRALRRRAARQARQLDLNKTARDAAQAIAANYGISVEAIIGPITALLRGTISSAEASRQLFACIAEPVSFVRTYFEIIESDRALPQWMSKSGEDLQVALLDFRGKLQPSMGIDTSRTLIQAMLIETARKLGQTMISLALDDTAEFGVDAALAERFSTEPLLASEVQTCEIVGAVCEAYVSQITGLIGGAEAKIEHSFGGDLMHALYLPHVDFWRGDRRFAALLKNAVPRYASRVVPTLKDLPAQIDAWQATASR